MSTSSCATPRHFSPWLSQTIRGQVSSLTRMLSYLPARTKAPTSPAMKMTGLIWLKEWSSASKDWASLTATRTRLHSLAAELFLTRCNLYLRSSVWEFLVCTYVICHKDIAFEEVNFTKNKLLLLLLSQKANKKNNWWLNSENGGKKLIVVLIWFHVL